MGQPKTLRLGPPGTENRELFDSFLREFAELEKLDWCPEKTKAYQEIRKSLGTWPNFMLEILAEEVTNKTLRSWGQRQLDEREYWSKQMLD